MIIKYTFLPCSQSFEEILNIRAMATTVCIQLAMQTIILKRGVCMLSMLRV